MLITAASRVHSFILTATASAAFEHSVGRKDTIFATNAYPPTSIVNANTAVEHTTGRKAILFRIKVSAFTPKAQRFG